MQLTLSSKSHLGNNVWRFTFAAPEPLSWLAGQFIRIGLSHDEPDEKGTTRWFTIAAAPYEQAPSIVTRVTASSFKQALASLKLGQSVTLIEQPAGDFIWRQQARPLVFAAQGIGITPFYAMIKDRHHHGLAANATLIYGTATDTEPIFGEEIRGWAAADPTLDLNFERGTLTAALLAERVPDFAERYVYVSGPKSFISLCIPPRALPLSHLKQDNFPGYAAANY